MLYKIWISQRSEWELLIPAENSQEAMRLAKVMCTEELLGTPDVTDTPDVAVIYEIEDDKCSDQ